MVVGCSGSGKSTLSRKLAELTDLPLIHLDQQYWKPNWTETPKAEWEGIVEELASQDLWIMDGNYFNTMHIRAPRADTIIFLDIPTYKCLWRVLNRTRKHYGNVRRGMPKGCEERYDLDFLHYVATYNLMRRKRVVDLLESVKETKEVIILKSNNAVKEYLGSIN